MITRQHYFIRSISIFIAGIVTFSYAQKTQGKEETQRPNVILVMTDDQGYGDLSCHGNPFVKTPNIDKLYREGMRFSDFHVNSVCCPTRAALMTGKYPSRSGILGNGHGRSILKKDQVTMAQIFEDNGYKTGIFGKWHLGDNYPYRPQDRGFQEVLICGGAGVGQNPGYWRNDYFDDVYLHNGKNEFYEGYCTDIWFGNVMRFIEENKDEPFFCYLPINAPHFWYFVPNDYTLSFREKGMDDYLSRYLGMIVNIDENMGKLLNKLDELALAENTILIFMTDNGHSNYKLPTEGPHYFNAGMRGIKGSVYDGGHRVPFFIRWPGGGITGGRETTQLTAHLDVLPTLIDLCQLENKRSIDFDGRSLVPLLRDSNADWKERTLCVDQGVCGPEMTWRRSYVMTEQYRLIEGKELYDINSDPAQENNIAEAHTEVVEELRREYEQWWRHVTEGFTREDCCRIPLGDDHANPVKLHCLDWLDGGGSWNQELIRNRQFRNGHWAVDIVNDGEYEFTCRTYPKEEDTRMNIVKVRLKISDQEIEKEVYPGSSEIKLRLNLKKGETFLQTWFYENDGHSFGAPYVYVNRL